MRTSTEDVTLRSAIPVLPVADIERAVAHYETALGCTRRHVAADYGIVWRDGVEIHFWVADGPEGSGAEPFLVGTGACRIEVSDVAEVAADCRARGATEVEADGVPGVDGPTYAVRDVDGNVVTFHA